MYDCSNNVEEIIDAICETIEFDTFIAELMDSNKTPDISDSAILDEDTLNDLDSVDIDIQELDTDTSEDCTAALNLNSNLMLSLMAHYNQKLSATTTPRDLRETKSAILAELNEMIRQVQEFE